MRLYHGSAFEGLTTLVPHVSEHEQEYVYLSDNSAIAMLYTVHMLPFPYNWYPYGFHNEIPIYTEYYPDALADVYAGRRGFVYECERTSTMEGLAMIPGAYVSEVPVAVHGVRAVADVHEALLDLEHKGRLIIQRFATLSDEQHAFFTEMMRRQIALYELHGKPDDAYSRFITERFPHVW